MKCTNCSFVVSEKKDICPKCFTDLRPRKQDLGLPILHPNKTVEEIIKLEGVALKQPNVSEPTTKSSLFGFLSKKKVVDSSPAPNKESNSVQVELTPEHFSDRTPTFRPKPPAASNPFPMPISEAPTLKVEAVSEETIEIEETTSETNPLDNLFEMTSTIEENIDKTISVTKSLGEVDFKEKNEEKDNDSPFDFKPDTEIANIPEFENQEIFDKIFDVFEKNEIEEDDDDDFEVHVEVFIDEEEDGEEEELEVEETRTKAEAEAEAEAEEYQPLHESIAVSIFKEEKILAPALAIILKEVELLNGGVEAVVEPIVTSLTTTEEMINACLSELGSGKHQSAASFKNDEEFFNEEDDDETDLSETPEEFLHLAAEALGEVQFKEEFRDPTTYDEVESRPSQHSSPFRRVIAAIIDVYASITAGVLLSLIFIPFSVIETAVNESNPLTPEMIPYLFVIIGCCFVCFIVLQTALNISEMQTVGGKICGFVVVDTDEFGLNFKQSLLRSLLLITTALTGGLAWLSVFKPTRQALHDKLAGTIVIIPGTEAETDTEIIKKKVYEIEEAPFNI